MLVAVTGTKGKTTVVSIISHCLSQAGLDNASICTVGIYRNGKRLTRKCDLRVYRRWENIQADYRCMEVTSHILVMPGFIPRDSSDAVVLTGIERGEHAEGHTFFKDYLGAKREIFSVRKEGAPAFVCRDSAEYDLLVADAKNVITYGFHQASKYKIEVEKQEVDSARIRLFGPDLDVLVKTKLLGDFNYQNIMASFLILKKMGMQADEITSAVETFPGSVGRFERYTVERSGGKKAVVVIDYAHTPASLKAILTLLRGIYPGEKICTVFGCGGDRTALKRPLMGREATELSDEVILADDNPRHESAELILDHILMGAIKPCKVIRDRKEAISAAIETGCGVVLLAGKGDEDAYEIGDRLHLNRSDRKLLQKICNEKNFNLAPFLDNI